MTKLLPILLAVASISTANAATFSMPADASSTADSASHSAASNDGIGNGANLQVNSYGGGTSTVRTTPTVYAPGMYGSFSQGSCMVSAAGSFSIVGLGASGGVPVDGDHCDYRLNLQQTTSVAMTLRDLSKDVDDPVVKAALLAKASIMLDASSDMTCLYSDRMRAVLESQGLCKKVADIATLDHRFNQPRSTQIDYSTASTR